MNEVAGDRLKEVQVDIRRLESRLDRRLHELRAQKDLQQQILSSTSWRITAPLRFFSTRVLGKPPPPSYGDDMPVPSKAIGKDPDRTGAPGSAAAPTTEGNKEFFTARLKQLAPGLPASCTARTIDRLEETNSTYRLVDCSRAIATMLGDGTSSLVADEASSLAAGEREDEGREYYVGRRADAPRIAFLGSTELLQELAFEAQITQIRERHWSEDLVAGRFSFALIETVWHVENREWRYGLIADSQGRGAVENMLRRCREISLPVVVWFREDLSNYERFAWLAGHADLVYAVDEAILARLRKDHPSARAGLLPPAIQPALYNPIRPASLAKQTQAMRKRILFDGWWELLEGAAGDALLRSLHDELIVVESEWEFGKLRLDDCEQFKDRALGCLRPLDKVALSKMCGAEVFLDSRLVLGWRQKLMMLRSAACGAIVVHPESGPVLPDVNVPHREEREALAGFLRQLAGNPLQRARIAHQNFRQITSRHCLADRLQRIADDLGIAERFVDEPAQIACLLVTMRPHLLPRCIERFRKDAYPAKELVVVVHGRDYDLRAARELVRPGEPIRFFQLGREHSLGACLNFAFAQTEAPYWSKMDDDDIYGPNYLSDVMLYQRAVSVPVFGKPTAFVYFEAGDEMHWIPGWMNERALQLRQQGQGSVIVAGGTIGGKREVLENVTFSERRRRGSDSEFLRQCHEHGYAAMATDCFNFALFRSAQQDFHTWNIGDDRVRGRSQLITPLADSGSTVFL